MKQSNQRSLAIQLILGCMVTLWFGCGDEASPEDRATVPAMGVSSNSLVVGETLELYLTGLPTDSEQDFQLMYPIYL